MARIEFPEETRKRVEAIGNADFVLGVAGAAHPEELTAKAESWVRSLASVSGSALKIVVAFAGLPEMTESPLAVEGIQFLSYEMPAHDPSAGPWAEISVAQRSVLELAALLQARACVVVHHDLATLDDPASHSLAAPVLDGRCDLVSPIYPEGKYDGLINKGLLAPLSRALFGRRVRSSLPFDLCASARIIPKIADTGVPRGQAGPQLLWPANVAGMDSGRVCQAAIHASHTVQTDGMDLSTVLGLLAGDLFQQAETFAPHWQRVRASQPAEIVSEETVSKLTAERPDSAPLDTKPLIESFALGSRNLEEVWRLVLPPVSLFELRQLARLAPEEFRMPDELWARIVYDFALAYRLRRIGRSHLLGALTPLYLGWVASYAKDIGEATVVEADRRVEIVAQAFEANKPYLVSRWRWPDRAS